MAAAGPRKLPPAPDESVWADAQVIVPEISTAVPALISDGGGLPFAPEVLERESEPLVPTDAPVLALLSQIDQSRRRAQPKRLLRRVAAPAMEVSQKLEGWRVLAREDGDVLFGRGQPPRLVTVATHQGRRGGWSPIGASAARPLRAWRDGARASSWRLDPGMELDAGTVELRVLLAEQSRATGAVVSDRLLPAEVAFESERVVVRLYVRPLDGYVGPTRIHETPLVVRLPEPLGARTLVDGAVYWEP